jgi:hypothetical protein
MKLRTLLKLQKAVEEREIPYDVLEFDSKHYSKSKDMTVDILDLHLTHAIRILNNYLTDDEYPQYTESDRQEINNNLKGISALNKRIEQRVDDIKEVVNE